MGTAALLMVVATLSALLLFIEHMELGHNLIDVAITVRDNPERFTALTIFRAEPLPSLEAMMRQHAALQKPACVMIGCLLGMFSLVTISVFTRTRAGRSKE